MPIAKGQPWGTPAPLPDDAVVVRSDAEAREVVEDARRARRPYPPLGLLGGDLCRTLGGGAGGEKRLRAGPAVRFPVDLGEVLVDGRRVVSAPGDREVALLYRLTVKGHGASSKFSLCKGRA